MFIIEPDISEENQERRNLTKESIMNKMTKTQIKAQYFRLCCLSVRRWVEGCKNNLQLANAVTAKKNLIDSRFDIHEFSFDDLWLYISLLTTISNKHEAVNPNT